MAIQDREITREEFVPIVPNPVCPHCHTENVLDRNTYGFYKGPVPCLHCPEAYMVDFSNPPGTPISQRLIGGYMVSPVRPIGDPVFLDDLGRLHDPGSHSQGFQGCGLLPGLPASAPGGWNVPVRHPESFA